MNSDLSAPASSSPAPDAELPSGAELPSELPSDAEPVSPPESTPAAEPAAAEPAAEVDLVVPQVRLKGEGGRLLLLLPSEMETANSSTSWTELWVQLKHRLNSGERFWQPNTPVHLIVRDRLLDVRQLQDISDALTEAQLHLKRVYTSRRQTAVAAATAGFSVEQQAPIAHLNNQPEVIGQAMAEPLYVHTTLRSGVEIRHPGSVIVLGDVNPGSSIVADGDVLVWGVLR
ncbi:MAG TPA: septum site-determining protein MinC, partial [Allocoleopsis sp.]